MSRTSFMSQLKSDSGMVTAEYAVGTIAAAGFGGLLLKVLNSSVVHDFLQQAISRALQMFLGI